MVFTVFKVNVVRLWSVFCILCVASLRKTGNQRQLFSALSRPLVPLLTTYASLICGQDRGLTTTTMDWVLSILCHRKSKALGRRQWQWFLPLPVGRPAIQKHRDREGNVSLPTLGLVAARCIRGLWWHNLLPC